MFETTDIGFASTLVVLGHKILETKKDSKGKMTFVFNEDLSSLKTEYINDNLLVSPRNFLNTLKNLKNI